MHLSPFIRQRKVQRINEQSSSEVTRCNPSPLTKSKYSRTHKPGTSLAIQCNGTDRHKLFNSSRGQATTITKYNFAASYFASGGNCFNFKFLLSSFWLCASFVCISCKASLGVGEMFNTRRFCRFNTQKLLFDIAFDLVSFKFKLIFRLNRQNIRHKF